MNVIEASALFTLVTCLVGVGLTLVAAWCMNTPQPQRALVLSVLWERAKVGMVWIAGALCIAAYGAACVVPWLLPIKF